MVGEFPSQRVGRKMMSELKPCPFCGGVPTLVVPDDTRMVKKGSRVECCVSTGSEYPNGDSPEAAVERWNTRHIPEGYALVSISDLEYAKDGVEAGIEGYIGGFENSISTLERLIKASQEP